MLAFILYFAAAISTFGIYCMYKEHVLTIGQTEKFPLPDCVECTCEDTGLKCCGYVVHLSQLVAYQATGSVNAM